MSSTAHGTTPYYFVPHESRHPVMAAIGLFFVILGAGQWINGVGWGEYSLIMGMLILWSTLFVWFKEAIGEKAGVVGEGWSATWKQNKSSQKVDYKLLLEALKPAVEVVDAYTREVPGARVFKFKTEEVDK